MSITILTTAHATKAFTERVYADFIEQLADISVVARSAPTAWKLFTHWHAAE